MKLGRAKLRLLHVQLGGNDARVVKKGLAEVPVPINLMVDTSQVIAAFFHYYSSLLIQLSFDISIPGFEESE